jgi:hypothetical protein
MPAYLNWNAGVSFTRKIFNLDLRYYDTNLSKEDCFVLTGDPNATARRRYRPGDKSRQNNGAHNDLVGGSSPPGHRRPTMASCIAAFSATTPTSA